MKHCVFPLLCGILVFFSCGKNTQEAEVKVSSVSLNDSSVSLVVGETVQLRASIQPSNATEKDITWASSKQSVATVSNSGLVTAVAEGSATIKAEAQDGSGVFASCAVRVKKLYTAVAGEAVDLGLSVKWSSMNLGATSPGDYGDYFAWGKTAPENNYRGETYEFSKYNIVDNKTEFKDYDYEDDAARQALGGNWRMPTIDEWRELEDYCTWTWTNSYNGSGVKGRIITGPNGNSIFLPAAGCWSGTGLKEAGFNGDYWSSSLYEGNRVCAYYLFFGSWKVSYGDRGRQDGLSVRPVSE